MFCKQCGAQLEDTAKACAKCSTPVEAANPTAAVTDKMKAASKDSLQAFLKFATDPVAGLSVAYDSLGTARALSVGISFGIVSSLCALLAAYRLIHQFLGPIGAGGFFKLLLCAVTPFVALAITCALARLAFRGKGDLSNDTFIAGAALLPFAGAMLLSGILGMGNYDVIVALSVFAVCLTILMLFAGCTRITKISERLATLAVPLMLMVTAWLSKIVYTAVIHSAMGSPEYPVNPMFQ